MGCDKAWVEWRGSPLIVRAVAKARQLGISEIFISGRPDGDYTTLGCPVLIDLQPGLGPLAGIERALSACTSPLLLVLAVDLPLLTITALEQLVAHCHGLTGVVPRCQGRLEPLAAIYPKRCRSFAIDGILQGRHAVRDFAQACLRERAVQSLRVSASRIACFANWNHPSDLGWDHSSAPSREDER